MLDSLLKKIMKDSILKLRDNAFQVFCEELLIKFYKNDFLVIKDKKDLGCDGIIKNNQIVAMYAPDKENLKSFEKKVTEDYQKYETNWIKKYPSWVFIYNGTITAERKNIIDKYYTKNAPLGIENLMEFIDSLRYSDVMCLTDRLNIDKIYITYNVIRKIIDDLSKSNELIKQQIKAPTYIAKKIEINFNSSERQEITEEYARVLPDITRLTEILKEYNSEKISSLINRVKMTYSNQKGTFNNKLNQLCNNLSNDEKGDDIYAYYIRVIVIYLFERCILGKKSEEEND